MAFQNKFLNNHTVHPQTHRLDKGYAQYFPCLMACELLNFLLQLTWVQNFRQNLFLHCCHIYERHSVFVNSVQDRKIPSSAQAPSAFGPSYYSYLQNCPLLLIHNIYSLLKSILLLTSTLHLLMMFGWSPMFDLQQRLLTYKFKVEVRRQFSLTRCIFWFGSDRCKRIHPASFRHLQSRYIWVCSLQSLFS